MKMMPDTGIVEQSADHKGSLLGESLRVDATLVSLDELEPKRDSEVKVKKENQENQQTSLCTLSESVLADA